MKFCHKPSRLGFLMQARTKRGSSSKVTNPAGWDSLCRIAYLKDKKEEMSQTQPAGIPYAGLGQHMLVPKKSQTQPAGIPYAGQTMRVVDLIESQTQPAGIPYAGVELM